MNSESSLGEHSDCVPQYQKHHSHQRMSNLTKTRLEQKVKSTVWATLFTASRLIFALRQIGREGSLNYSYVSQPHGELIANYLQHTIATEGRKSISTHKVSTF